VSIELCLSVCCYSCYSHLGLLEKLLTACIKCLKPQYLDLPMGLVGRLTLCGSAFIDEFVNVINDHNVSEMVINALVFQ